MKAKYIDRLRKQWNAKRGKYTYECGPRTKEFVEYLLRQLEKGAAELEQQEAIIGDILQELDMHTSVGDDNTCEACRGWRRA